VAEPTRIWVVEVMPGVPCITVSEQLVMLKHHVLALQMGAAAHAWQCDHMYSNCDSYNSIGSACKRPAQCISGCQECVQQHKQCPHARRHICEREERDAIQHYVPYCSGRWAAAGVASG